MMLTVGADQFIRLFRVDLKALENKLKAGSDVVENVFNLLGEVQNLPRTVPYKSEFIMK